MKQSALHNVQKAIGAVFTSIAGWATAAHYGDPNAEYDAARNSCAVFDLSFRGKLHITGQGARAFLQGQLTKDMDALTVGKGVPACALTEDGRLLAVVMVYALDGYYLLEAGQEASAAIRNRLRAEDAAAGVQVQDLGTAWGLLSLQGPECSAVLDYLSISMPDHRTIRSATLGGQPVLVAGRSRATVPGVDIFVAASAVVDCWNSLMEGGARPAGMDVLNVLRIEAGIPWHGTELDESVNPLEAGLDDTIDDTKPGYVGQEAIAAARRDGRPERLLRGILLEESRVPPAGAVVCAGDQEIGHITSAAFSPLMERAIALAYLRQGHTGTGVPVRVLLPDGSLDGQTVLLPFVAYEATP